MLLFRGYVDILHCTFNSLTSWKMITTAADCMDNEVMWSSAMSVLGRGVDPLLSCEKSRQEPGGEET